MACDATTPSLSCLPCGLCFMLYGHSSLKIRCLLFFIQRSSSGGLIGLLMAVVVMAACSCGRLQRGELHKISIMHGQDRGGRPHSSLACQEPRMVMQSRVAWGTQHTVQLTPEAQGCVAALVSRSHLGQQAAVPGSHSPSTC